MLEGKLIQIFVDGSSANLKFSNDVTKGESEKGLPLMDYMPHMELLSLR